MTKHTTNIRFSDVRTKIWLEEELYKFMKELGLLEIGENEQMVIISAWNRAVIATSEHSLEKLDEQTL